MEIKPKIIGYKVFSSNNEFQAWQKEYEKQVIAVAPFVNNFNASIDRDVCGSVSVGGFVTYLED